MPFPSIPPHSPTARETGISGLGRGVEMKDGGAAQGGKQGDGAQEAGLAPGQDKHAGEQA